MLRRRVSRRGVRKKSRVEPAHAPQARMAPQAKILRLTEAHLAFFGAKARPAPRRAGARAARPDRGCPCGRPWRGTLAAPQAIFRAFHATPSILAIFSLKLSAPKRLETTAISHELSSPERQNVTNGEPENAVLERYERCGPASVASRDFFARRRRADF